MKLLERIRAGFSTIAVDEKLKEQAENNVMAWLANDEYAQYREQLIYMIEQGYRDELLDSFYQVLPFGTGGRRGLVGVGPNRINPWTIMSSAQGHSQFLLEEWGDSAKEKGVVLGYDVRMFTSTTYLPEDLESPLRNLDGKRLVEYASSVYVANGIRVCIFPSYASTPEISFMVTHLGCVAGEVMSASHNPPEYNGQKIMDETGGQLIPPHDERLVEVVTNEVDTIQIYTGNIYDSGLVSSVEENQRQAYQDYIASLAFGSTKSATVYFSPFHGTSQFSVLPILDSLGYQVDCDEITMHVDPTFSGIPGGLPNPEIEASYMGLLVGADKANADIILTTDPDGDRIGLLSKEDEGRRFFTGNEIAILVCSYLLEMHSKKQTLHKDMYIITTMVTTGMLRKLADVYGVQIIDHLLVGMKYIAHMAIQLEEKQLGSCLLGVEESHGSLTGKMREKDSAIPAIYLSELASLCKDQGVTVGNYLSDLYAKYGYFKNYLTDIKLPGADGMGKISRLMSSWRENGIRSLGKYPVLDFEDMQDGGNFVSKTDKTARNVLQFTVQMPEDLLTHCKITVRPSGTEPKVKFYIECATQPFSKDTWNDLTLTVDTVVAEIEKLLLIEAYSCIGMSYLEE